MLISFEKNVFYLTVACMLSAVLIASCSRSKEQNAAATEQLPLLSTSEELDTVSSVAGNQMLVLDFYADWCRPCKILAPAIEELAGEYKGKARFFRVNVDTSPALSRAFGVQGIPYVVFMKNGQLVYALRGIHPAEIYKKVLDFCTGPGSPDQCVKELNEKM